MSDSTLYTLVNPEIDFNWNGTNYHVRKANLEKIVLYQERARALSEAKDIAGEIKLTAFCIYLILRDSIPELTEEKVMQEAPGDINAVDVMIQLGFLNAVRVSALLQAMKNQTGEKSSSTLPIEQDGHQEK